MQERDASPTSHNFVIRFDGDELGTSNVEPGTVLDVVAALVDLLQHADVGPFTGLEVRDKCVEVMTRSVLAPHDLVARLQSEMRSPSPRNRKRAARLDTALRRLPYSCSVGEAASLVPLAATAVDDESDVSSVEQFRAEVLRIGGRAKSLVRLRTVLDRETIELQADEPDLRTFLDGYLGQVDVVAVVRRDAAWSCLGGKVMEAHLVDSRKSGGDQWLKWGEMLQERWKDVDDIELHLRGHRD